MKTCNECGGKHYAKGKCRIHYKMPSQLNPKPIKSKVTEMTWEQYQAKKKSQASKPRVGEIYEHETSTVRVVLIKPTKKEKTVAELVKLADIVFSKWIQKRDALTDGTFRCISCSTFYSAKEADCGHFYSRRFNAIRFHEDNCHSQCVSCNRIKNGNIKAYRINLEAKIGSERLKWLDEHYRDGHKCNREELLEIIKRYKV